MLRIPLLVLALLPAACCAAPCRPCSAPAAQPVAERTGDAGNTGKTDKFEWAVMALGTGSAYDGPVSWLPDAKTVELALTRVRTQLEAESHRVFDPQFASTGIWHEMIAGVRSQLDAYKCQVFGVEREGKGRRLYLNFVHRKSFEPHPDDESGDVEDWTRDPHFVDDGGDWYWQVYYDPATRAFEDLSINGEA